MRPRLSSRAGLALALLAVLALVAVGVGTSAPPGAAPPRATAPAPATGTPATAPSPATAASSPAAASPPAAASSPAAASPPAAASSPAAPPPIAWRRSRPLGSWTAGALRRGVQLPAEGKDFVTWDPVLRRSPNRPWRRWATDRLLRTVLTVLREHRAAHAGAPRVPVGDLSRPRGGDFGRRFGGLGHVSHQNGLDADVYYPRLDHRPRRAARPEQVDRRLAQDLVDRFVAAGAEFVFVGPRLRLRGPRRVVQPLAHHDDHLHVRLPLR